MKSMFSCKEVSRIVSDSLDRKLSIWTRVRLWMHLGMCGVCARFRKTMIRVDKEVKLAAEETESVNAADSPTLSDQTRQKLQQALSQHGN